MGDDITIGVTEIVNTIEVTAQPNDQIVDINVTDNADNVTLDITPTVIEINVNKGSSYAKWGDIYGTLSDQTDLQNALNLKANLVDGKVPASELPSYVDDIIEVANYAALPATGEIGKIYVTLNNNKIYRWSGSVYIEIASNNAIWGSITGTLSNQTDLQTALDTKALKTTTISTSAPLTGGGSLAENRTISIPVASGSADGYLSSANWTTFNNKQSALSGTGFVKISGTTISYDNTTYLSGTVAIANGGTGATNAGAALTNLGGTTVGANIFTSTSPSPYTSAYLKVRPDNSVEWLEANNFRIAIGAGTGNGTVTSVEAVGSYGGLTLTGTVTGSGQITLGGTPEGTWPINVSGNASSVNTVQAGTSADYFITCVNSNNGSPTAEFLYTGGGIKANLATGALTAGSFVKSGGTSSQYLMADGSVSTVAGVTGTGTTNYIPKFTGSTALGNSAIYEDANGSFGLGTTSPNYSTSVRRVIDINGSTQSMLVLSNGGTAGAYLYNTASSLELNAVGAKPIYLSNNGAIRTTIDASGNVGIGTTSPASKLNVSGDNITVSAGYGLAWSGDTSRIMTPEDNVSGALIQTPGIIRFNAGSSEKMRITSGGNVGIGTTSPSEKLQVNGNILAVGNIYTTDSNVLNLGYNQGGGATLKYNSNGNLDITPRAGYNTVFTAGNVTVSSGTVTATGFFNSSDIRLKQITDYDYNVSDIKPITYLWKDGRDNKKHVGYSAQEVQKVMPDAVNEGTDGMLSVNYVEVLVAKIAQMEKEIELLKSK